MSPFKPLHTNALFFIDEVLSFYKRLTLAFLGCSLVLTEKLQVLGFSLL
jgi:hypothetical protein